MSLVAKGVLIGLALCAVVLGAGAAAICAWQFFWSAWLGYRRGRAG